MATRGFDKGWKLRRLQQAIDDPKVALKQIGELIVSQTMEAFEEEKLGSKRWKPRAVPNVFGIIADFAANKKEPPKKRFEARPVLMDSGDLSNRWKAKVKGDAVIVGTVVKYASVHQTGGPIKSKVITKKVQKLLGAWLKTKKGRKWKGDLGWLLNKKYTGKEIPGKVEARPMLGITVQLQKDIYRDIGVAIMEAK
jgi:phage gpG-like protein